ncbi:MSC_0882 family membrane protein [Mycoplasma sp. HU2014]|uniref:MSC_0882 family membrane protein n=1 Tax=Mycoplasma sp. HU2014 TaxID=1664275 RepID=UPI0006A3E520|nr:hypothetical protein [Mycoplasma sp. HU2014]KNG79276.1 membrane protein [Mycoplasma sp. HU2014]
MDDITSKKTDSFNLLNENHFTETSLKEAVNTQQHNLTDQTSSQNKNPLLLPKFSRKELDNVEMPDQIAKEIRMEKYRILGIQLIGILLVLISAFFLIVYFTANEKTDILGIDKAYIPNPILMGIVGFIGLIILIIGLVDYRQILLGVRTYKTNLLIGKDTIPFFLIKHYRYLIKGPIYINWLCSTIYLYGSLTLGIMIGINEIFKRQNKEQIISEIIIVGVILIATILFHVFSLISIKWRKGNISSYYGYEILSSEEIKESKKQANKQCLIVFFIILAIVLFIVFIPYMLIRKKKRLSLIPFLTQ